MIGSLRLKIRPARPVNFRAFIPVDAQPFEAVQDRLQCGFDVSALVGIIDTQNELPTMLAGIEPVKQCGSYSADMQVSGGAGCESCADHVGAFTDEFCEVFGGLL